MRNPHAVYVEQSGRIEVQKTVVQHNILCAHMFCMRNELVRTPAFDSMHTYTHTERGVVGPLAVKAGLAVLGRLLTPFH